MAEEAKARRINAFWTLPDAQAKALVIQAERKAKRQAAPTAAGAGVTPTAPPHPEPPWILLARRLGECGPATVEIKYYVRQLGAARCQQLVEQAEQIHAGVGLLSNDGQRRCTKGGIFFKLAKDALYE